jgi:hypothetical protein
MKWNLIFAITSQVNWTFSSIMLVIATDTSSLIAVGPLYEINAVILCEAVNHLWQNKLCDELKCRIDLTSSAYINNPILFCLITYDINPLHI